MSFKFILFILIVLLLIFGMHFAFFKSLVHFFSISRPSSKTITYTIMVFLCLSFISAFFMLHWQTNVWTIGYYRFAAVWMGFLIHFLVAVSATWIIIGVLKLTGLPGSRMTIAAIMLSFAAAYSVYSLWSTFHPCVREITIGFKHLPPNWERSRIVQLSDVHLGTIHGKSFAERVVSQVNGLDPDLILITGDLLDGVSGNYEEFIEPLKRLHARHGIFFVTGNHEYYVGIEKALSIIRKAPFRILDNEMVTIDGLEVLGVGYPGIHRISDITNLPEKETGAHARILMFHTPTNLKKNSGDLASRHFSSYWMPDTSFELNKKLNCDLQLSGHTHHGQIFPFNFVTRLLFKKYDYGLNRIGDFQIYTTCGTGSWGPPMRSPVRPEIVLIRPVKASVQSEDFEQQHNISAQYPCK